MRIQMDLKECKAFFPEVFESLPLQLRSFFDSEVVVLLDTSNGVLEVWK